MDSSDIYYSDNSQLIDETNSEWIENTVLIENQAITWQEDGPEITVDYSETTPDLNKTISENDEYLTAENEDSNTETSQYFSILETNCDDAENEYSNQENAKCFVKAAVDREEIIIPDLAKTEIEDDYSQLDNVGEGISDDQVIVYRMEGSDDLYAVQLADDGNGNFQKYKYRVRQNDDGQFEAIPGSIEIQKADQNEVEIEQNDVELEESQPKDQKPTPETLALINQQINENDETEMDNNFYINSNFENINPVDYLLQNSYEDNEEEYQTVEGVHVTADSESNSQPDNIEATEFVSTNTVDSESEYEIEELDEAFQDDDIMETSYNEQSNQDNLSILQHKSNMDNLRDNSPEPEKELRQQLSDNHNVTIYKDDKNLSYLVVNAKEKENVSLNRPVNLRSILKSNYSKNKIKCSTPKPVLKHTPNLPAIISSKEPNSKPIKEPAAVNTILLKSARQPRKQTIKPVDRAGSEIIVQPLIYSLSGDNCGNFLIPGKRKRIIDEVLQVSDESDPEFTLKPKKKKVRPNKHSKRGRPKNVEITIIDSDDEDLDEEQSDGSVIEVLTDAESSDKEQPVEFNHEPVEKPNSEENGENNKNEEAQEEKEDIPEEVEKSEESNKNNEATEETRIPEKDLPNTSSPVRKSLTNKKNKCPYCPKTFPRLITLKKHMNIHSNRRSLRSRTKNIESENKKGSEEKSENRELGNTHVSESLPKSRTFKCLKCKLNFLTESQFKRHQTIHITKNFLAKKPVSPANKKILISQKHLRSQNNLQAAENNLKSQRLSQIKKSVVNDRKPKEIFKCEYCNQSFATRTVLSVHRNSHKTFPCPNCKTTFTAKILLDDHLRKNCVKIMHSPKKLRPVKKFSPSKRINSKCEICQQIFPTPKSLQIHKNVSHKPKVRVVNKPTTEDTKKLPIVKKKGAHGGVPMSLKMQQALSKLKVK